MSEASDDQLAEGFAANRDLILSEIFNRMPDQFDPSKAEGVQAVVEWEITERPGGGADRWQLAIRDGTCTCVAGGEADPDVTFTVGPVDFVKMIAGAESGPKLFVFGKLKIRGNLMLAARVQGFFRMPGATSAGA
ncbi:MAG: SCP2 sterol-binding domain-containing protein [Actinobacteria bacterium]|nr:SCP2 sterol-binding domain-containing protein [Actinomycetota bacterium]